MFAELKLRLGDELNRLMGESHTESTMGRAQGSGLLGGSMKNGAPERLQRRVLQLGRFEAALPKVDPATIYLDRAGFGSEVTVLEIASGQEVTYTLSAGEFIDVDAGEVSLVSPIGFALLRRRPGDEVVVATPRGERRFKVIALTTLPQRLGMELPTTPIPA